jgi:hypothetical protein
LSPEALEELVARFLDRTLPHGEWTHQAHLSVGMWHVHRFGTVEALERLRENIRRLNDVHGTPNSETRGYHETITRAYVTVLAHYIVTRNAESIANSVAALLASPVAAKDYLLRYYSKDRLMSPEARAAWVEPDLGDLGDLGDL